MRFRPVRFGEITSSGIGCGELFGAFGCDLVSFWDTSEQGEFMILIFRDKAFLWTKVWSFWKRSNTSWEENCRLEFVDVGDGGV